MSRFAQASLRLVAAGAAAAVVLGSGAPALAQEQAAPDSSLSFLNQSVELGGLFEAIRVQPQFRVDRESPVEDPAGVMLTFFDSHSLAALEEDGSLVDTNNVFANSGYDNCLSYNWGMRCVVPYDLEAGKSYTLNGTITYVPVDEVTADDAGLYDARDISAVDFTGFSQVFGYDPANDNNLLFVETTEVPGTYGTNYGLITFDGP